LEDREKERLNILPV